LKQALFCEEYDEGKLIRFISAGRLLKDNEKFDDIKFASGTYIHASITNLQPPNL
jgi:hypothetical protein